MRSADYRLWGPVVRLKDLARGVRSPELPKEERDAIRFYGGFLFRALNRFLREGTAATATRAHALAAQARLIASGLNRLPDYRGTVTRSYWSDEDRYVIGEVTTDDGFASATRRGRIASVAGSGGGATRYRLIIKSRTGKSVAHLMFSPREEEVVFRPGTRFLVTAKKDRTPLFETYVERVVHLEEVP